MPKPATIVQCRSLMLHKPGSQDVRAAIDSLHEPCCEAACRAGAMAGSQNPDTRHHTQASSESSRGDQARSKGLVLGKRNLRQARPVMYNARIQAKRGKAWKAAMRTGPCLVSGVRSRHRSGHVEETWLDPRSRTPKQSPCTAAEVPSQRTAYPCQRPPFAQRNVRVSLNKGCR